MAADRYWHNRFAREGRIWGETPSTTVKLAVEHFRRAKVEHVLVPGCAYGRNARELARSGFRITGLESCDTALRWARDADPKGEWIGGSVLEFDFSGRQFDGLYCFNLPPFVLRTREAISGQKMRGMAGPRRCDLFRCLFRY